MSEPGGRETAPATVPLAREPRDDDRPTLRRDATAHRLVEGRAFVISLDRSQLHELNDTGTTIWNAIVEGCTFGAIVERLRAEFDVDEREARADVSAFVERLASLGLIEQTAERSP